MKRIFGLAVCCHALASARVAAADRWVDDRAVLEARRFAFVAGYGLGRFEPASNPSAPVVTGSGVNLEEAAGLGHELELGVRFGARLDDAGRGLHADAIARGTDAATLDLGTAVVAHPELRLRWRGLALPRIEAGLEGRLVLPLIPDPSAAALFGPWASLHLTKLGRADLGVAGILTRDALDARALVVPGVVLPENLWLNVGDGLFAGALGSIRYLAPTSATERELRMTLGLAVGYRLLACDLLAFGVAIDSGTQFRERLGLGLSARCRSGGTSSGPE